MQTTIRTKVLKHSDTSFEWCINQYNGCSHGCKYCYGMTVRKMTYDSWIKPQPRKDVVINLQKDIQWLKNNDLLDYVKDIFLGSITDSYQPLETEHKLTRQIIEVLKENNLPFTILTKGNAILRDIDLLKDYPFCRAGVTLISLNDGLRRDLEPNTAPFTERIRVLSELKDAGISTYLSCEPILPVEESNPVEIVIETCDSVNLFEFGLWNKYRYKHINRYYWKNYSDEYYIDTLGDTISFCEKNNINYCIASHSREFCLKYGLPFKPYPPIKD